MANTTKSAKKAVEAVAETAPVEAAAPETAVEAPKKRAKRGTAAKKETAPKKAAAKKEAAPKRVSRKAASDDTVVSIYIQQNGNEVSTAALTEKAKIDAGIKSAESIDIYVRPEINMVYYVIDGEKFGNFELC